MLICSTARGMDDFFWKKLFFLFVEWRLKHEKLVRKTCRVLLLRLFRWLSVGQCDNAIAHEGNHNNSNDKENAATGCHVPEV